MHGVALHFSSGGLAPSQPQHASPIPSYHAPPILSDSQELVEGAPDFWIDRYGLAISSFAVCPNPFAWHVDHRVPVACGGATDAGNLDAVQHRFNHCKRDRCAAADCFVGAALHFSTCPAALACAAGQPRRAVQLSVQLRLDSTTYLHYCTTG